EKKLPLASNPFPSKRSCGSLKESKSRLNLAVGGAARYESPCHQHHPQSKRGCCSCSTSSCKEAWRHCTC
ncbi:hypothetical protein FHG87_025568, partial [Trinorchestia longiramus]